MNSAHDPCACAARSRSNATSCSAWWHSRSIKYSASRSSGPRRPERRPLRPREHRENSPRSMNFARGSAVNESTSEPPLSLAVLVEMHLCGVLVEPGGDHVLGLFDRDPVDVVDAFADGIVLEPVRRPAQRALEGGAVDRRAGGS